MPTEQTAIRGVFVSYRREDTSGYAGRLVDSLKTRLRNLPVFMDIDSIKPGQDFSDVIVKAVGKDTVLLALIGHNWLHATTPTGQRRLDDPGDFVRMEIRSALQRGVTVIPVLVQGARMPSAQELPGDLQKLAFRQAISISDERWSYDVGRLAAAIQPQAPAAAVAPPGPATAPPGWPGGPGQPMPPPGAYHPPQPAPAAAHKSHTARNVIIGVVAGVVGVIVLITIVLVAANPGPSPSPTPLAGGSSSTPTPQPTPTPAPEWSVNIDHFSDYATVNNYQVTDPSTHFLVVFANVTNTSDTQIVLTGEPIDLWDSNGHEYREDQSTDPLSTDTVDPRQTVESDLAFVVPNGLCNFQAKVVLPQANADTWSIDENKLADNPPCS